MAKPEIKFNLSHQPSRHLIMGCGQYHTNAIDLTPLHNGKTISIIFRDCVPKKVNQNSNKKERYRSINILVSASLAISVCMSSKSVRGLTYSVIHSFQVAF